MPKPIRQSKAPSRTIEFIAPSSARFPEKRKAGFCCSFRVALPPKSSAKEEPHDPFAKLPPSSYNRPLIGPYTRLMGRKGAYMTWMIWGGAVMMRKGRANSSQGSSLHASLSASVTHPLGQRDPMALPRVSPHYAIMILGSTCSGRFGWLAANLDLALIGWCTQGSFLRRPHNCRALTA